MKDEGKGRLHPSQRAAKMRGFGMDRPYGCAARGVSRFAATGNSSKDHSSKVCAGGNDSRRLASRETLAVPQKTPVSPGRGRESTSLAARLLGGFARRTVFWPCEAEIA